MSEEHRHGPEKSPERLDALVSRLHRIEGQVKGIERMVRDERYCVDILTQVAAATKALDRVALELLEDHLSGCVTEAIEKGGEGAEAARADLLRATQAFGRMR